MSEIRVSPDKISIDERGRVVIDDPKLAAAIEEDRKSAKAAGEGGSTAFLDYKCTNLKCP